MISDITIMDSSVNFDENQFILSFDPSSFKIPNCNFVIGQTRDGQKRYYFRFPNNTSDIYDQYISTSPFKANFPVIYYTEQLSRNIEYYNSIVFSLPILDFFLGREFIQSENNSSLESHEHNKVIIEKYPFKFNEFELSLSFFYKKTNEFKDSDKPQFQLEITSNDPFTPDHAYQISRYISGLFSFLYNSSDISIGTVLMQNVVDQKVVLQSSLHFVEQITNENDICIPKFAKEKAAFLYYREHLGELICMCFKDDILFSNLSENEKRTYDLKRILFRNFEFEYYYRHLIVDRNPNARFQTVNERDGNQYVHDLSRLSLRNKLVCAFNPNILTGRRQSGEVEIISISNIIWEGVDKILDYYSDNSFRDELITTFKKWRDAEAHALDFNLSQPNLIESIRFVECLNYCIVLKQARYSVEAIRSIIYSLFFDLKTMFYDNLIRVCQSKIKELRFDNDNRLSLIWQSDTDGIKSLFKLWDNRLLKKLNLVSIDQSDDIQPFEIMHVNNCFTYNIVKV